MAGNVIVAGQDDPVSCGKDQSKTGSGAAMEAGPLDEPLRAKKRKKKPKKRRAKGGEKRARKKPREK